MSLLSELQLKYKQATIADKLIFINVGVFAVIALANTLYFLFSGQQETITQNYLALPASLSDLVFKPWTILSYFFVHSGFMHLLGNMIALYFFGRIFLTYFNARQFLNYYFIGGLFAGLVFILSYNIFPALVGKDAFLVGASASVFAILFGATAKAPNFIFNLFGVLRIPMWVIASLYTILFISTIPYANAGGELAHLGGAFLGYFYTKQLEKGKNIGAWFEKIADKVSNFTLPSKKKNLKTVYKKDNTYAGHNKKEFNEFNNQKQVDIILDKISKSGYDSLTKVEKEFLFKSGK